LQVNGGFFNKLLIGSLTLLPQCAYGSFPHPLQRPIEGRPTGEKAGHPLVLGMHRHPIIGGRP
jgi:hypothetical protein